MKKGQLIKLTLNSGIEITGEVTDKNFSSITGAINLISNRPLPDKDYVNKECFPTGEINSNGVERVKYISDKYKTRTRKNQTICTIYPKTIKDIVYI